MFRSPLNQLVLALGALALTACAEDRTPTEPGAEPASAAAFAAALAPNTWTLKAAPPNGWNVNQLSAGVVPDASGQSIVYTLGGRGDDGGCGGGLASYKIGTNTWTGKGSDGPGYSIQTASGKSGTRCTSPAGKATAEAHGTLTEAFGPTIPPPTP